MPATLEELAMKLGVSASTVSRVVNNKKYVKPLTREKVLRAIEESGYTPNQIARNLKYRQTKTVAYVVPDISEDFFAYVYKGVDSVLGERGYNILMCDTDEDPAKEEMYLDILSQKQIDGVILATVSSDNAVVRKHLEKGMKVVFFDNLPGIGSDCGAGTGKGDKGSRENTLRELSVLTDNIMASRMAVRHLVEQGHRNIGIITGKQEETTGHERFKGFMDAMAEQNLTVADELVAVGDFKEKSGYECMKAMLERNAASIQCGSRTKSVIKKTVGICGNNNTGVEAGSDSGITAVYVTSSKMTYGAIKAIIEKGLDIPGDIALVGFDIRDPSGLIKPGITTLKQNETEIGRTAARLLLDELDRAAGRKSGTGNSEYGARKVLFEPALIIRESSGRRIMGCNGK